jgi:hypothetical protein
VFSCWAKSVDWQVTQRNNEKPENALHRKPHIKSRFVSIVLLLAASAALAQTPAPPLDAAASDPRTLGIMQGFPPPADKTVRIADGSGWTFPQIRWAFSHTRELGPTVIVWRGSGRPAAQSASWRSIS